MFFCQKKTQKTWQFQIGTQKGINVPNFIFIGFQQPDREASQNLNKHSFCRLPVTSAQYAIGTEKNRHSAIILYYTYEDHSQGYG